MYHIYHFHLIHSASFSVKEGNQFCLTWVFLDKCVLTLFYHLIIWIVLTHWLLNNLLWYLLSSIKVGQTAASFPRSFPLFEDREYGLLKTGSRKGCLPPRKARLSVQCDSHMQKFRWEMLNYFLESLLGTGELNLSFALPWDETKNKPSPGYMTRN